MSEAYPQHPIHAEPEHHEHEHCHEPDVWAAAFSRCGWNGNGACLLAGTEHCDFHCPFDATARAESDPESATDE
jgi:hypothetical protein